MAQRKAVLELAEQAEISLLELTDLYNEEYGTSYSTKILNRLDDNEAGGLVKVLARYIEDRREKNRRRR